MDYGIVPDVKKIAVLRALVLGDLIFCLPALEAIHAAYPQSELYLLARPWTGDFLTNRVPGISKIIGFRSSPREYEDLGYLIHPKDAEWFFPQMQAEQFDLAISMQGGGKNSNSFIQRLKPGLRIGSREDGAIAPDRWILHDYYQNEVIRNLDLAGQAGAPPVTWTPRLPVLNSDRADAAPFLEKIQRPYVVIHSGARDIRRCWPPKKFAAVADRCKHELGMEVVLTGSAVDAKTAFMVESAMQETPVNLSHRLTLTALIGVLANAGLVLSNDTGVLHLGLAVGARAVGLYWGEYVAKSMPLSRKCFYPLIAWERRCPTCGMFLNRKDVVETGPRPCRHQVTFLASIPTDQVFSAVERMLAST